VRHAASFFRGGALIGQGTASAEEAAVSCWLQV